MKKSYHYALEKLHVTMEGLALGEGDIRSRLLAAFFCFHTLRENDFPKELREDWNWVKKNMTKYGPIYKYNGEVRIGSVKHTMKKIKNRTGVKIAEKLLELYKKIKDYEKY